MPFTPKFVDLVRNLTSVQGTGPVALGAAVNGYTSLAAAVTPGEQFYYCIQGVDKPAEREVGRGTMQAGGTIAREAVSGALTNFSAGTKTIALVAAAEWFSRLNDAGAGAIDAAARSDLASAPLAGARPAFLTERGREGMFAFDGGNLSATVSADGAQGLFVAPGSDTSGASGAWVRKFDGAVSVKWFGAKGDGVTDDSAAFVAALALLKAMAGNVSANGFWKGSVGLLIPAGHYYLGTTTLDITHTLTMQGEGGYGDGSATRLRWAKNTVGIRTQSYNTSSTSSVDGVPHFGANWCVFRDLEFVGAYNGVDALEGDFHGLHLRAMAWVEGCAFRGWQGEGVRCRASIAANGGEAVGNVSISRLVRSRFESNRMGLDIRGDDANVIKVEQCEAIANRRIGFLDSSGIGSNSYLGCHAAQNGIYLPGDVPTQCSHGGNRYAVRWGQETWAAANAPSGTSADNVGWLHVEAGVPSAAMNIPAWSNGMTLRAGGDYFVVNDTARVTLHDCYSEETSFNQLGGATLIVNGAVSDRYRRGGRQLRVVNHELNVDGNIIVDGVFRATGPASTFGPQSGVATDNQVFLDNTNVSAFIYGRSWAAGVSQVDATLRSFRGLGWFLDGLAQHRLTIAGADVAYVEAGGLSIVKPGAKLGYGAGAGGAATQATSKSTSVTLNRASGQVTLSNAALAAGASVSLSLTNSVIAASDVVIVSIGSGASANSYAVHVDQVAAGSCRIQLRNVSAAALSEALTLNFAVVKAVAA